MKAYMVLKNADMTEGHGPMIPSGDFFKSREVAERFIDTRPGVNGRFCEWSKQRYADWRIVEIDIKDTP